CAPHRPRHGFGECRERNRNPVEERPMAETVGELIIPGTYIEVRAEGLIGVGGIATGNIGVVGTGNRGPLNEVVILGSSADALAVFGTPDPFPDDPAGTAHLTLARTLEQLFAGGA